MIEISTNKKGILKYLTFLCFINIFQSVTHILTLLYQEWVRKLHAPPPVCPLKSNWFSFWESAEEVTPSFSKEVLKVPGPRVRVSVDNMDIEVTTVVVLLLLFIHLLLILLLLRPIIHHHGAGCYADDVQLSISTQSFTPLSHSTLSNYMLSNFLKLNWEPSNLIPIGHTKTHNLTVDHSAFAPSTTAGTLEPSSTAASPLTHRSTISPEQPFIHLKNI